jgi:hypothetical protein
LNTFVVESSPGFKHPFLRKLVNIALASLAAFAVVGSAACALRIVLKY